MKYLLGILNSKLLSFLYPYVSNKMVAKSFPRLSVGDIKNYQSETLILIIQTKRKNMTKWFNLSSRCLS